MSCGRRGGLWLETILIVVLLLLVSSTQSAGKKKDCIIVEEKGWFDLDNVYTCDESAKCCKEYGQPSCCVEKDKTVIIRDQAILWGGLLGFLLVLGLIIFCKRNDFYVMEGGGKKKCCCCGSASKNDVVRLDEEDNY